MLLMDRTETVGVEVTVANDRNCSNNCIYHYVKTAVSDIIYIGQSPPIVEYQGYCKLFMQYLNLDSKRKVNPYIRCAQCKEMNEHK